jgi:hypothetical protein
MVKQLKQERAERTGRLATLGLGGQRPLLGSEKPAAPGDRDKLGSRRASS